ncbi:MAG: orotidine-5'-phosphate decarboxylase [Phycisphaerales bacterium]|nr:orotidine-5'-phosphate decarboxylase [Phycisphaerales bacterium]
MADVVENFADRVSSAVKRCGTPAVVGIDPQLDRLPPALVPNTGFAKLDQAVRATSEFSRAVIDAVAGVVPAVKINSAFFEAFRDDGVRTYFELVRYARDRGLIVIGDVKRGDIGSTSRLYAEGHIARPTLSGLDDAAVPDAVTLAGYLGESGVRQFVDAAAASGRGVFVLVRPSDPTADVVHEFGEKSKLYEHLAGLVASWGSASHLIGKCGLSCVGAVVAPKDPESTTRVRQLMPRSIFLVPGYGAQGASAEACRPCFLSDGRGAFINASRSVIFSHEAKRYSERFGDDWKMCIRQAAKDFAADVAGVAR